MTELIIVMGTIAVSLLGCAVTAGLFAGHPSNFQMWLEYRERHRRRQSMEAREERDHNRKLLESFRGE